MLFSTLCVILPSSPFPETPVYFTQPLEEQTCYEFDTCTFVCVASNPTTPVTWYKNGVEITPSEHCKPCSDNGTHSLTLSNVALDDEAEYVAKLNECQTAATLLVEGILPI